MSTLKTPLTASLEDLHVIAPLEVVHIDGPLAGTRSDVTRTYSIAGLDAVWSSHGDGFYWLRPAPERGPTPSPREVVWEPHPDARFPWVRLL